MGRRINQINASILVNAVYAMQGYPAMLISNLLSPLSIIIIVSFVSHGMLTSIAIAGAFMTLFVGGGLSIQADLAHLKNDFKFQDMIVSSPTGALAYLVGMALSELIFILPSLTVLIILAFLFLHASLSAMLVIVVVLALMYTFATVFGFFLSTITTDVLQSWAFSGILSILLTTIPPVYYPITYIPLPYRYIAYISPTTYAAGIVQNALGFLPLPPTTLAAYWVMIIAVSLALFPVAIKKNKWRDA